MKMKKGRPRNARPTPQNRSASIEPPGSPQLANPVEEPDARNDTGDVDEHVHDITSKVLNHKFIIYASSGNPQKPNVRVL